MVSGFGRLALAAAATLGVLEPPGEFRSPSTFRRRYPRNRLLNRSNKWPRANSYQEARNMSPSTKPVR